MRKIVLACMVAMSVGLAGCGGVTTLSNIEAAVSKPVLGMTLADEKALASATNAYNFVARSYLTANSNGQLSPSLKARVKPLVQQLYAGLKALRAAYKLGDAASFEQKRVAFYSLKDQINALGVGK